VEKKGPHFAKSQQNGNSKAGTDDSKQSSVFFYLHIKSVQSTQTIIKINLLKSM
jgi:hypothetical protein